MKERFKNHLYTREILVFRNSHWRYFESADGTLFSGHYRTKILAEDLPAWYIYGRYYKCWGYLSTKGITDLLYVPNKFVNHFLKDDCLLLSYGGKITENDALEYSSSFEKYTGFDERVWGSEIIGILKGARRYSDYDISGIIQQLKEKEDWLTSKFPEEFGSDKWSFDVDKCFEDDDDKRRADMEKFKYLQPLDQMARVSRADFGNRLDEILAIVDKDNVGYVITDEGKGDLILCPARWLDCI